MWCQANNGTTPLLPLSSKLPFRWFFWTNRSCHHMCYLPKSPNLNLICHEARRRIIHDSRNSICWVRSETFVYKIRPFKTRPMIPRYHSGSEVHHYKLQVRCYELIGIARLESASQHRGHWSRDTNCTENSIRCSINSRLLTMTLYSSNSVHAIINSVFGGYRILKGDL